MFRITKKPSVFCALKTWGFPSPVIDNSEKRDIKKTMCPRTLKGAVWGGARFLKILRILTAVKNENLHS